MLRALFIAAILAVAAPARADSALEHGLERFQAADFAAAIPLLETAHAENPVDPDTALLLGISYFRVKQTARARPLLEQAERDGDDDDRASARIFLGLIAEQQGEEERARVFYEQVARQSQELGGSARLLLDQAGPARWLVVAVMRPGFDSNVALLPMTPGKDSGAADGELDLVLAVSARPVASLPLVLDQSLAYSKQIELADYDMVSDRLGARYVVTGRRQRATVAYYLEVSRLGGELYQLAHVAELGGRHRLRDALSLGARYTFAARDYGDVYAEYSGLTHTGNVELIRGTRSSSFEVAAGYQVEREGTSDALLTNISHGPRATLRWRIWPAGELRTSVVGEDRIYDKKRRDLYVTTDSALYIDLTDTVGLVGGGSFSVDHSSDKSFGYLKWTAFCGVIVVISD